MLREKVRKYIQRSGMICAGDTVTAALSGGADSVCLFLLLLELRGELEFSLAALHVNHRLRGEAADADEAFVRDLCERTGIPLRVIRRDVAGLAAELGTGTEEAGRIARREAFSGCEKVALAHHLGDQAETFLFRASRGSSLSGLAAMRPVERLQTAPGARGSAGETVLIRPLLEVSRGEIEAYLSGRGQAWCEDATNADPVYARNAIRGEVIPALEQYVNAGTVRHLAEAAETAAEADAFLREEALRRGEKFLLSISGTEEDPAAETAEKRKTAGADLPERVETGLSGCTRIGITDGILELPGVLRRYLLREALRRIGALRDLRREHIAQLEALFSMQTGKRLELPHGLLAVRGYGGLRMYVTAAGTDGYGTEARPGGKLRPGGGAADEKKRLREAIPDDPGKTPGSISSEVPVTGPGRYRFGGWVFDCAFVEVPAVIEEKTYTKWFDYDKIYCALSLRARRAGDWITATASGGRKKLKDYMIDEKIPQDTRDRIPLLASDGEVHWIVGHRIGETCKVTGETRRVLRVQARREDC